MPVGVARSTAPRNGSIDLLRVIGIAAVVVGHVWGTSLVHRIIYPWHVPLFYVLSGYFWSSGRTLRDELGRRWRTLGRPYVFWLVVMLAGIAALMIRSREADLGVVALTLMGGANAGRPFSAFWFVSVLFCTMMLARLVDRLPVVAQWCVAAVGLLAIAWQSELLAHTPLGVGLAPGYLSFVLFGRLLRRGEPAWTARPARTTLIGLALIAVGGVVVALGWSAPLDLKQGDLGTPVVGLVVAAVLTAGLVLVAGAARGLIRGRVATTATTLASAGICAVLVHPGVLFVLRTPESGRAIDLVVALVLPWALGVVALRTPLSGWLNGVEQRQVPVARSGAGSGARAGVD